MKQPNRLLEEEIEQVGKGDKELNAMVNSRREVTINIAYLYIARFI